MTWQQTILNYARGELKRLAVHNDNVWFCVWLSVWSVYSLSWECVWCVWFLAMKPLMSKNVA